MHEKSPVLTAKKRERIGSRYSARIREQGGLPAIVYGHKEEPLPVSLDFREALSHQQGRKGLPAQDGWRQGRAADRPPQGSAV